jgi:serine/threonine protein kinase
METDRFHLIKEIFQAVLERRPEEREAFLAIACGGDDGLRLDVEALLMQQTENFLETPAIEKHARLLAGRDSPEETFQLQTGESISHYRIVSSLGRGGMGEVYLAEDLHVERKIAIKLLRGKWMHDAERVRRFEQEARAASSLNHPNIVTIHDIGQTGSIHYIATEFIDGQTLRQKLKNGRFELSDKLEVIIQIAEALAAAHAAGFIHRDIKPENVMIRKDGYVKVLDFGIAKRISSREAAEEDTTSQSITATGSVLGTAHYMSPEQARGQKVDARTDIFSLGVTIYEMLTGQQPFTGDTEIDVAAAILTKEQEPLEHAAPGTPIELRRLVNKALRKRPEERHQTISELLGELKSIQQRIKQAPPPIALDAAGDAEELSPLLSEFDFSKGLQNWLRRDPHGGRLAFAAAAGALIAILLSCVLGAACIRVQFESECFTRPHVLFFGYLVEFNAGLLYFIGVPIFIVGGFHLINRAYLMLRRLINGKRLIAAGYETTMVAPLEIIRRRNRRLFRALLPVFVVFAFVLVCGGEYLDRNKLAFGWVQALSLQDLQKKDIKQIKEENKSFGQIPFPFKEKMGAEKCVIQVNNVVGGHGNQDRAKWKTPFLIFVAIALGLQIAFIAFVLWLTAKIMFLFVLLCYALLDRPHQIIKITLDFGDEKKRFGLSSLDLIHNALLTIVFCVSIVVILQQISNAAKGTSFFSGGASPSVFGQALLFLVSLIGLTLLLALPAQIFIRLIETAVERYLVRIDEEEARLRQTMAGEAPDRHDQDLREALRTLEHKRELAQQQRPWPRENLVYRRLMTANIILLFLLLSNSYAGLFESAFLSAKVRGFSDQLCAFCSVLDRSH